MAKAKNTNQLYFFIWPYLFPDTADPSLKMKINGWDQWLDVPVHRRCDERRPHKCSILDKAARGIEIVLTNLVRPQVRDLKVVTN